VVSGFSRTPPKVRLKADATYNWKSDDVRRIAVRHPPDEIAAIEIDRGEDAVGRFDVVFIVAWIAEGGRGGG